MVDPEFDPESPTGSMWSRRSMVGVSVGAAIGAPLLTGCKPCFPAVEPKRPNGEHPGPRTLSVRARISENKYRKLRALLDESGFNPFEQPGNGIHYARLFTTTERSLYFMVIYDRYEQALEFLSANAAGVDQVFSLCDGYPPSGAGDRAALGRFIESTTICVELFYRAYSNTQPQIRDALEVRKNFLAFLRRSDGLPDGPSLTEGFTTVCNDPHLESGAADPEDEPVQSGLESSQPLKLEPTAGLGRVNPFTLLARLRDDQLRKVHRTLRLGTWATIDLGLRPLANLPTLHFAAVSVINHNQLLFASVYDGDFIQYVEDFGTRIAKEIDKVFGACVGYPMAGSRDVPQFKDFLRSHQIQTNAFAGSYLDHTLLEIESSLALSKALAKFQRHVRPDHPRLRTKLNHFLHEHQQLLT